MVIPFLNADLSCTLLCLVCTCFLPLEQHSGSSHVLHLVNSPLNPPLAHPRSALQLYTASPADPLASEFCVTV